VNPKKYKDFEDGIAEEVGVHPKVVSDFIDFFYTVIRKKKLEKTIKRNKDILGNLAKNTYNGYEKSVAVKEKLEMLEKINAEYDEILKDKQKFKIDKYSKTKS
jgi:DNA-binding transcriptional regulator GbsR (MarR family)